jgi:hypothetical protein
LVRFRQKSGGAIVVVTGTVVTGCVVALEEVVAGPEVDVEVGCCVVLVVGAAEEVVAGSVVVLVVGAAVEVVVGAAVLVVGGAVVVRGQSRHLICPGPGIPGRAKQTPSPPNCPSYCVNPKASFVTQSSSQAESHPPTHVNTPKLLGTV